MSVETEGSRQVNQRWFQLPWAICWKINVGVGDHSSTLLGALKSGSFWSSTPIAQERLTKAKTNPPLQPYEN